MGKSLLWQKRRDRPGFGENKKTPVRRLATIVATFLFLLIPIVPSVATGTDDPFMLVGIRTNLHAHPTIVPSFSKNVLVCELGNKNAVANRTLKLFKFVSAGIWWRNPIKRNNFPNPISPIMAAGQPIALQEGVLNFLHYSRTSAGICRCKIKINLPILEMCRGITEKKIGTLDGLGILFTALDTEPAYDHQTISEVNQSQISAFRVAYQWILRLRFFIGGSVIALFGAFLMIAGENDGSPSRFIYQVAQAVGPIVMFIGVLITLANIGWSGANG